MLQIVSECIQYATCGLPVAIARYGVSVLAYLLILMGAILFQIVVYACGMDQLVECSKKARAFIHLVAIAFTLGYYVEPAITIYSIKNVVSNIALEIVCIVLLTIPVLSQWSSAF